jgi:hypothetical protein
MAYGALDPWDEQSQQDEFSSSFFQQPQPYAAPAPEPEPPPAPSIDAGAMASSSRDPFTSSVFAKEGLGDLARGAAPPDYGMSSGSSRQPPTAPAPAGMASGSPAAGSSFDYGSLVGSVRDAQDPRQRAVAQDQLARATYAQLKQAGHEVSWEGDNLVVDGRPYVIGDGASAAPAPSAAPAAAAPSGKTPTTSPYQQQSDLTNASGGRTQGGAQSPQEAYDQLAGSMDPNASKEDMEAAIEAAFGHLPGYGGAYKESVMLNGRWYDMVTGYGGAGASWGGLTPKGPSKSAMTSSLFGSGGLMSGALSPFGGSGGVGVGGSGGVEGARGVELSAGLSPSILALLQQQQAPEPEPMSPSYMNLLR